MKKVKNYLLTKQNDFSEIDFFKKLEEVSYPDEATIFLKRMSFFVMSFQDMLRLNEAKISDPFLKMIARHHKAEDRGHDKWFLHDLYEIDNKIPDIQDLYGDSFSEARDTVYALMSEVFYYEDDLLRISFLLMLESTGHVFFNKVVSNFERLKLRHNLLYFDRRHLDVEMKHQMFEDKINDGLDSIELTDQHRESIEKMIDRCYQSITVMLNSLID